MTEVSNENQSQRDIIVNGVSKDMPKNLIKQELAGYSLQQLLDVKKKDQFDELMDAVEKAVDSGELRWRHLDDDQNNVGQVHITSEPVMGILENDSNAKDACMQKLIDRGYGQDAESPREVIRDYIESNFEQEYGAELTAQNLAKHVKRISKEDVRNDKDGVVEDYVAYEAQKEFSSTDDPWVSVVLQSRDSYFCMDECGHRECVTIDIADRGCGIKWNNLENTILKFHSRSKTTDPRMIGKYGQGGSTALAHVSNEGGSLYFTCHHEHPNMVSVPVVKCVAPEDNEEDNLSYVYLVDANTNSPVVLLNANEFSTGTTIRHFGYKLHKKDMQFYSKGRRRKTSLYTTLTERMVDPVIKTRIFDDRYLNHRSDSLSDRDLRKTTKGSGEIISGALPRVRDAEGYVRKNQTEADIEYISPKIDIDLPADNRDLGYLTVQYAVAGHLVNTDGSVRTYIHNFVNGGENGKFYLSGQAVQSVRTSVLKDKLNYPFLKKYLLVYVDVSGLAAEPRATVIQSSRDSMTPAFEKKCYNAIAETMNDDSELERWNEKRKKMGTRSSVGSSVVDRLKDVFSLAGGEGPEPPSPPNDRPEPEPEPVEISYPPTFLELRTSDPRRVPENRERFSVSFMTDASPSFLKLDNNLQIECSNDLIDVSDVQSYAKGSSVQGYGILQGFTVSEDATIGDTAILTASLNQNGKRICHDRTEVVVTEKPEPRTELKGYQLKPEMVDKERGDMLGLTDPDRHIGFYHLDEENKVFEIFISSYSTIYQRMQEQVRNDDRGAPGEDTLQARQDAAQEEYQYYVAREAILYYNQTLEESPELSGGGGGGVLEEADSEDDEEPMTPFEQRLLGAASAGSSFLSDHTRLS